MVVLVEYEGLEGEVLERGGFVGAEENVLGVDGDVGDEGGVVVDCYGGDAVAGLHLEYACVDDEPHHCPTTYNCQYRIPACLISFTLVAD